MHTSTLAVLAAATFDEVVRAGCGVIAVELGAEWRSAGQVMAPALAALAEELAGKVRFYSVDADASLRLVTRFAVRGLPTVLLFPGGELVERVVGAQSKAALRARLVL